MKFNLNQSHPPPLPDTSGFDANLMNAAFAKLNQMLDEFRGRRTPRENVGSDRRSPSAGPSDIARPNPIAQVSDTAPQGPDSAPGPSTATHVPPPLGPSLHDAPSDGEYVSTRGGVDEWEHVRYGSRHVSPPERLRDELERTHAEISQLRDYNDFCRARGRAPPDHYYRDLDILTWSVVALIRSLHEKKLLPMDDPVISQLQKSFSKACGNVASCLTSNAAFVTLKRRQLLLSHVVPSVSDAQKRNLLSDPFFQTSSLFSASSVEAARSAARDLSLFKPHLRPPRRRLHLVVHRILALWAREALLDNLLDNLLRSNPLPLSDSSLARRAIRASRRSPPEPPRNGEVFGSRSLVPLWRSVAA